MSTSKRTSKQNRLAAVGGYKRQDSYWAKAKEQGYAARSVFKLEEIDDEHRLLTPGAHVLDLGCAPGSWLQIAAPRVGKQGRVLGVDLEAVTLALPANVKTLQMDVWQLTLEQVPEELRPLDVVLSDLAPHTTGIRSTDQARAFELSARAVRLADGLLRPGGSVLVKTFQGEDTPKLLEGIRKRYDRAALVRPKATRKPSFEVYLLGKGFKGTPPAETDPLAG